MKPTLAFFSVLIAASPAFSSPSCPHNGRLLLKCLSQPQTGDSDIAAAFVEKGVIVCKSKASYLMVTGNVREYQTKQVGVSFSQKETTFFFPEMEMVYTLAVPLKAAREDGKFPATMRIQNLFSKELFSSSLSCE